MKTPAALPADAVAALPEVDCQAPLGLRPGTYELFLTLKEGNETLSENSYEVTVAE